MFYAPWDAKSQDVRSEFEKTAKFMEGLISFAAINCWQPGSECRNQYNKVYNWPVFIAYLAHGRGIQYNGPRTAAHMIKFLNGIMRPLIRVKEEYEVNLLLGTYDVCTIFICIFSFEFVFRCIKIIFRLLSWEKSMLFLVALIMQFFIPQHLGFLKKTLFKKLGLLF